MSERVLMPVIEEWMFPRTGEYVPVARRRVGGLAEKLLGCGERASEVELAAGEMLANAAVHGDGPEIVVRVRTDGRVLRAEVHDGGIGPIREPTDDPMAESGRGLLLVMALTSRYDIEVSADGTCAWFEADL